MNLLDIAHMRMMAKQVYISDIKEEPRALKFSVHEKAKYDPVKIAPFIQSFKGTMMFLYNFPKGKVFEGDGLIRLIEEILDAMRDLVEKEE